MMTINIRDIKTRFWAGFFVVLKRFCVFFCFLLVAITVNIQHTFWLFESN